MNIASRGSEEISGLLEQVPLFSALSAEELAEIAGEARLIRAQKGEVVCQRGDRPQGCFCVVAGQVKLALLSAAGFEKVVDIVSPGMTFAEALMFVDQPCPVYAQALTDTTLLFVPDEPIMAALDRSSAFARRMLLDLESQCLQPAAQRVIGYLLREVEAQHSSLRRTVRVKLPVSKAIIASHLNVTPETLSRTLGYLAGRGLISVKGPHILVHDVESLRACGRERKTTFS
jgi:CRP-like cAMP-binding protein